MPPCAGLVCGRRQLSRGGRGRSFLWWGDRQAQARSGSSSAQAGARQPENRPLSCDLLTRSLRPTVERALRAHTAQPSRTPPAPRAPVIQHQTHDERFGHRLDAEPPGKPAREPIRSAHGTHDESGGVCSRASLVGRLELHRELGLRVRRRRDPHGPRAGWPVEAPLTHSACTWLARL